MVEREREREFWRMIAIVRLSLSPILKEAESFSLLVFRLFRDWESVGRNSFVGRKRRNWLNCKGIKIWDWIRNVIERREGSTNRKVFFFLR